MKKETKSSSALEIYKEAMTGNKPKLEIIPWTKYRAIKTPKEQWRINQLVPYSGTMSLVAPSGNKKTWFALEMMRSIASGKPFLDREEFAAVKSNVLYIENESTVRGIQDRCNMLGFDEADKSIFFPNIKSDVVLRNDQSINNLLAICKKENIGVIFFDTFSSTTGSIDSNSADDVTGHYQRLRTLVDENISVVIIDHCRKGQGFKRRSFDLNDVLGSQAKVAAVDVVLMIRSEHESKIIEVHQKKNRLDEGIKSFRISMESIINGNSNRILMKYDGNIDDQKLKLDEAREFILEYLTKEKKEKISKEIITALKDRVGKNNIENALKLMRKDKEIKAERKGIGFSYSIIDK